VAPLTSTIEVARTPETVFGYVTDPTRFSEWQANVIGGRMGGKAPYKVGERCLTTRRIGFAQRAVTSEITHIDPPRRWGVRGVDGPIRAIVDVTVDPLENGRGSQLTINLDFQGIGIGRLLVPLAVGRQARKEMPANLERLKQNVEAQAEDQPAR
jgi:uncharacterized protein YndB with AHSA1/START domain